MYLLILQGGPPCGDPPCGPPGQCWPPPCVPINDNIWILGMVGIAIALYCLKKKKHV